MTGLEALLLLGGAALLYVLNQTRSIGNLNFYPDRIASMAFEGMSPVAYATVLVQNTSNVSIELNSLVGSLFMNDTLVGNVSNFTPLLIQDNSETILPLKIRLQLIGIVNDIIDGFQLGNFHQDLRFEGTVNANGVQVPLSFTYTIG